MFAFISFVRNLVRFFFGAPVRAIETTIETTTTSPNVTTTSTPAPATAWYETADAVTSYMWEGGKATFHPAGTKYAIWGNAQRFDSATVNHAVGCWHVQHADGKQAIVVTNQPMAGWQLENVGVSVASVVFGDVVAGFGNSQHEYTNSHEELEIRFVASREFATGNFALHVINRAEAAGWTVAANRASQSVTKAWREDGLFVAPDSDEVAGSVTMTETADLIQWILEDESDRLFIASQYE